MKQSYLITFLTKDHFYDDDYQNAAGQLVNLFSEIFTNKEHIATLTKSAPLTAFNTELEVTQPASDGLTGTAVVDMECETKVQIDKTKLSALVKKLSKNAPWESVRIEKRAITDLENPPRFTHKLDELSEAMDAASVA